MYDEENVRYRPVRRQPVTLRLRILDGGPRAILTAKGPARYERRIKIREETEVVVSDATAMRELLNLLGHKVAVVYHKHRETWSLDGCEVTLDTLDFGLFSEVEGPADAIERVAAQLGLADRRPLKSSYSELARLHAKEAGLLRDRAPR
jgi:predicted adenylyl cyclase CyaB